MMQQEHPMSTADLAQARTPTPDAAQRDASAPPGEVVPRHDLESTPARTVAPTPPHAEARLFRDEESGPFRDRWMDIQTGFVDEPRRYWGSVGNILHGPG